MKKLDNLILFDCHVHVGFSLQNYFDSKAVYMQSIDEVLLRMEKNDIDYSIIFPFPEDNKYKVDKIITESKKIFVEESFQYKNSNIKMLQEIKRKNIKNLLSFVMINTNDNINEITDFIEKNIKYIYGIKINTVASKVSPEDIEKSTFTDICEKYNLPIIFHTRACEKKYNYKSVLNFAKKFPKIKVCVSHAGGFSKNFFEEIKDYENVFFDISPLHYLCYHADMNNKKIISKDKLLLNYKDYKAVLIELLKISPTKLLFGTDSPVGIVNFNKDGYNDNINILKSLNYESLKQIEFNTICFLGGKNGKI